jgi:uncharacterized protein YndB with AHSA1/START domain
MKTDDYLKRAEVTIERVFDAPPERVFRAWTDPEVMGRWMWASLGKNVWAECDLRVGGAYRVYSNIDGGRHQGPGWSGMCGLFVEVVADRKLVYTVHWDADVGYNAPDMLALDEVVSVTFTPDGERTRMAFTHMGIPDDGVSEPTHRAGIDQSFDMLADVLAS